MATVEKAINLPFTIGYTGSIEATVDQTKIWADRVLGVVGTAIGERTQRYYFGSKVHQELFSTATEIQERLPEIVSEAFASFLPLLSLDRVETSFDSSNGTLTAEIFYLLPDDVRGNVTIGTIIIDGNLPFKEV
jgi:phage baseplate assembly protein W